MYAGTTRRTPTPKQTTGGNNHLRLPPASQQAAATLAACPKRKARMRTPATKTLSPASLPGQRASAETDAAASSGKRQKVKESFFVSVFSKRKVNLFKLTNNRKIRSKNRKIRSFLSLKRLCRTSVTHPAHDGKRGVLRTRRTPRENPRHIRASP